VLALLDALKKRNSRCYKKFKAQALSHKNVKRYKTDTFGNVKVAWEQDLNSHHLQHHQKTRKKVIKM
jgi:hypothetical protein